MFRVRDLVNCCCCCCNPSQVKELVPSRDESMESKGFTRESNLLSEYIHPSVVNSRGPFIADTVRCSPPWSHFELPYKAIQSVAPNAKNRGTKIVVSQRSRISIPVSCSAESSALSLSSPTHLPLAGRIQGRDPIRPHLTFL